MHNKRKVRDIKQELLNRLSDVLRYLLPHGKFQQGRFLVGNLQGDKGKSLSVTLSGKKAGLWHDFATGEGGDILSLWARVYSLDRKRDFAELFYNINHWLEHGKNYAKPPTNTLSVSITKWDYFDAEGNLIACVYRHDTPAGKTFRPWDVTTKQYKTPNPRPLYNQPQMLTSKQVILCEGEKAAQALIDEGFCATTAMNGAKAPIKKTDWSPLIDKDVILWPDKDKPGFDYAQAVGTYLSEQAIVASLSILHPPEDKSDKWDAADAVAEGMDIEAFLSTAEKFEMETIPLVPAYTVGHLLDDTSPMPNDLIGPRLLTPGGLMVFGGAPKVGKSDFLLSLLAHMAAGESFLGLKPPRPLKIFYLQAEIDYHYLRERLHNMSLDESLLPLIRKNLVITSQLRMLLNENGVKAVHKTINHHFKDTAVDIIVVDPLRNVFDGGENDANENDNTAMLFFLQYRLDALREMVSSNTGIILAHHTRKIQKKQLEEDPFQALSGASSLRGYYTTGLVMFQPDENQSYRQIIFELRNGPKLKTKIIDKVKGTWQEIECGSDRLVNRDYGRKLDAERRRKRDVILQIIYEEARVRRTYTMNQFAEAFENKKGLGGHSTINGRIRVLATKGYIKFFKNPDEYGLPEPERSKYGYLCVENMQVSREVSDPNTGEVSQTYLQVLPTHYKCPQTGVVIEVENPNVWVYQDDGGRS